ncbi:inactive phospholipase C-like protein 2 isoform X2 [Ptychodera flava]|uniref:inactive phospholipase C-like protein 2 isoform X2 n=1 Tax=Ptychodera flava TaxID=63121 RepID=UPI00396A95D4
MGQGSSHVDPPAQHKSSDCITFMQAGSELIKVRSQSRQYHRIFSLDDDLATLRWHPTSKKPNKAKISIDQIKEVRVGKNTETLRNKEIAGEFSEECAFSIIYGDNYDSLDLVANTPDEANIWTTGLTCLIGGNIGSKASDSLESKQEHDMRDRWLKQVFGEADNESTGQLDEFEVIRLMKELNTGVTTCRIKQKFKEVVLNKAKDGTARPTLTFAEFLELFKEISTRPEIYFLLVRYASYEFLTTDDLQIFVEAEQGMTGVTKEKCLEIINRYEPSDEGKVKGQLGIDGFTKYLMSAECDIFDPTHMTVCQDMTQPISHYFIASSHNTYLMEDQLKGPSNVEGYIRALQRGCRWLELDCWDGAESEPIIYHGHTLTSKITFKSAVEAINEHAFTASQYPLFVSLENHCCPEQQRYIVKYLTSIFKEKLYKEDIGVGKSYLPSPEELKGKIILKGKKLPPDWTHDEGEVTDEDEGTDNDKKKLKKDGLKKITLIKELSDLISICKSVRFEDFHESAQKQKVWEMCSLSEGVANKFANLCPEDFVNHTKRFLTRIYPNTIRVDSSNYNPQDLWNCGCQIVTQNYQTPGLMMDLYEGRFKQNGGCGFVLKPAVMREEIAFFSANTKEMIPGVSPQILHIKIVSGQQFPKPKGSGAKGDAIDPYVSMEIFGIPADCAEERTKSVPHNGYNPLFDESFEFTVNLPELALVRFVVLDDDYIGDEFIGQYTIPFECLQPGYRHIGLLSNTGEPLGNASLFVHIAITNRRGGGKPTKRGMSVKKSRRQREYTNLRVVGVKCIDETFKAAVQPLKEATDLRENVQNAQIRFKECCGLASIANIKQCVRVLATRLQTHSTENLVLMLEMKDKFPELQAEGSVPEMLKKALAAYEQMVAESKILIEKADDVVSRLEQSKKNGLEWHEELHTLSAKEGLKGRKITKAQESFAWNIRVLKGQADLLSRSKKDSEDCMKQILEAASALGLVKPTPTTV